MEKDVHITWIVIALCCFLVTVEASIIAKSSITNCVTSTDVKTYSGKTCSKMLVVALTVTGDEGKSRFLQADVSKVVDNSNPKKAKNVQLQTPIRIRVRKSPVLVHFDMHKVATFSHHPYEILKHKSSCRSDWYAYDSQLGCGRLYTPEGEKIFDSQGVCCGCDRKSSRFDRAMTFQTKGYHNCMGHTRAKIAHCMRLSPLMDHAYELEAPRLIFNITVDIEEESHTIHGEPFWNKVSHLELGPHRRISSSNAFMIKAEYIADFYPDTFAKVSSLMSKYVVIPDLDDLQRKLKENPELAKELKERNEIHFMKKSSEWLAVDQNLVSLPGGGNSCNRMGVSFSDFKWQTEFCSNKQYSCLYMQAHNLYWSDKVHYKRLSGIALIEMRMEEGKRPQYMLHTFGKLHSITNTRFSMPTGHITFKANRNRRSLVVITLAADDLKIVTTKSPGRIVEAYIDPFEALTETGELVVIVQNVGTISASYQVAVLQCSAGIDFVPSDLMTLDPQQTANISFEMHSIYSVGTINKCDVELHNQDGELQDNMTVFFETEDTCFCYGHCGCACGNETNTCPPLPTYHKNDSFVDYGKKFRHLKKFVKFMKGNFGKFILLTWFVYLLICLGMLKVLHMLMTGQVNYPAVSDPMMMAAQKGMEIQQKIVNKWCPACYKCVSGSLQRCCLCCFSCIGQTVTGKKDHKPTTVGISEYERGWRRPRACNGMCEGARTARRLHRKQMRINKRKGMKNETVWYQKKYECTCKVSDTMPCLEICKGLFFFFYLPTLPLWWTIEFIWEFGRRKWQRHKRKKRYRALKASREAKNKDQYLSVDQYTRGKVEKQILDISQKNQDKKDKKKNKGFNAEGTSQSESSDTTDEEQAGDIDELVNPGYPVYFNYASIEPTKAPLSLKSPGKCFSIKGKLIEEDGCYIFELFKYTHQVKYMCSDKAKPLNPAKALDETEFRRKLNNAQTALKLITLSPLFTTLNNQPKTK